MKDLLRVESVSKFYPLREGMLNRVGGRIEAVNEVSFAVQEGMTFGVAGESGSGKSTLCMCVARLLDVTGGRLLFEEQDYTKAKGDTLRRIRRKLQIVFQNPLSSLDPHMTVRSIILEPMKSLGMLGGVDRQATVRDALERVGLSPSLARRFPHELSGGQSQRVAIARALSVGPKLLILDEPTSALDASIQAQILNLFNQLQRELGITYLLVSHDLSVVGHMCDRIAVMYAGRIVETGTYEELFYSPSHPYTAALLGSARMMKNAERFVLGGDMPSPRNPPKGCTLHPRCPFVTQVCRERYPELVDVGGGHKTACHNRDAVLAEVRGKAVESIG
ncbi:MAG: ABC transporter ATP-binding protein [Nitrososphaerales archaeon]|nr:ABC transporter ATP-binding protein [Nitrososphaerales archaeon]